MKSSACCLLFACSVFAVLSPLAAQAVEAPRLVASSPGQVFTESEPVTFAATSPVTASRWTLLDWSRLPLRQGDWPADGRLALGTLPKGYYFVTLEGASPSVREGSFCVVPDPSARRMAKDVPYGIDAALSWVCSPKSFATTWYGTNSYFACLELIRRCGVTHLRERLRAAEVSHRPGEFSGGRYLENARRARQLGLTVSGMFHDMPTYAHRGERRADDLKAVFDFCRRVGLEFGDAMGDWEFWNEQDIPSFWLDSAWNYAAALKAAYLGFKTANPDKPVLNGAFCTEPGMPFQQCVYRNGLAQYSDIYNVHYYGPPVTYGRRFDQIRAALASAGCPDRCVWMTECSTQLEGESTMESLMKGCKAHSYEQELVLAEVYAKGRIGFQMQGVARDYFFVFGAHNERAGVKDWGIQRRDGSVKPVYAAISAMTERLGAAKLVGEKRVGEKAKCFVFAQPDGSQTIAAWSVSPVDTRTAGFVDLGRQQDALATSLTIDAADGQYAAANWCGTPLSLTARGGRLAVPVTRYVTFVDGLHGLSVDVPAIKPGKVGALPLAADVDPTVVLQASFDPADVELAANKASVEFKESRSSACLVATVWNLSERPKRGKLSFGGVAVSCDGGALTLPAWGHVAVTTEVSLASGRVASEMTVGGTFDGRRALPLVAVVKNPNALYAGCVAEPLAAERADFWVRNDSAATMKAAWDEREKALRFDLDWTARPGVDRWFYPRHVFAKGEPTLDGAVAVEYEAKLVQNKVENDIRHALMMFEYPQRDSNRVRSVAYTPPTAEWHKVRVTLTDDFGKSVACGATGFKLGFNPVGSKCSYWIRNLRILRPRATTAETAEVRILKGKSIGSATVTETRTVELEKVSDVSWRFTLAKESIPADALAVEVVPSFMTAKKGDAGYWINGRGVYGNFDRGDGENRWWRSHMPLYGLKRGGRMHWAQMKTYRFDYDLVVRARKGRYEIFPCVRFDKVREFFPLHDDVVIDFARLEGDEADYNGMAHAYRRQRLSRGEIVPIRERMKRQPELGYLSEAMVIRLQTHGAKSIPEKRTDFYPTNEPPINVYLPFDEAAEFVRAIRDAGVDKAAFVSAGWNAGGYDGRLPDHFPVEPVFGGEEGLRRLIRTTQDLGFMIMLHATHTEVYRVCPHFDERTIAKKPDGSWCWNGLYFGGSCYWICERCSWEGWIADEMRQMRALGTHGSHYIDVFSATYPNRCADPRHPATPEQMAGFQNMILAEAKRVFGGASSEGGYDHVAGNVDCINYISVEMKKLHDGKTKGLELVSGVYPLWELVYHGIVLYTSDRLTQNHTRGQNHPKKDESGSLDWLEGDGIVDPRISLKIVEWGGRPIFYTYKMKDVPAIARAVAEFRPVRHLQKEEMLSHREIAPQVFETCYGNGERTICNYSEAPYPRAGKEEVPPLGYVLERTNDDCRIHMDVP